MSLVVAVWDENTGIMAGEGRALDAALRPVTENLCKVHRLDKDLVLGACGDSDVLAELRRGIMAGVGTFKHTCDSVSTAIAAARRMYPDGAFSLLLMGVDGGRVRCALWFSKAEDPCAPLCPVTPIGATGIGFSAEGVAAALRPIQEQLTRKKRALPDATSTREIIAGVFADLSKRFPVEMNARMTFESVGRGSEPQVPSRCISQGDVAIDAFALPGDTQAVMFEPPSRLASADSFQIWIGAVGVSDKWGGCNVWVSLDGLSYGMIGSIETPARLGTIDGSSFPSGSDPDTTNALWVLLAENSAPLDSGTSGDADAGTTLCYVGGEVIAHSNAVVVGQNEFKLDTYIRRGQMGTAIASHAAGAPFLRLDNAIFKYPFDRSLIGRTIYFKFQSVNQFKNRPQDLSAVVAISFALGGISGRLTQLYPGSVLTSSSGAGGVAWTNPTRASDSDNTTAASITHPGVGSSGSGFLNLASFGGPVVPDKGAQITFKMIHEVTANTLNGANTYTVTLSWFLRDGTSGGTIIRQLIGGTLIKTTESYVLPLNTDPSRVSVQVDDHVTPTDTAGSRTANVYGAWLEAIF